MSVIVILDFHLILLQQTLNCYKVLLLKNKFAHFNFTTHQSVLLF